MDSPSPSPLPPPTLHPSPPLPPPLFFSSREEVLGVDRAWPPRHSQRAAHSPREDHEPFKRHFRMLGHLTVLFLTADLDAQDARAWRPWPRTHLG